MYRRQYQPIHAPVALCTLKNTFGSLLHLIPLLCRHQGVERRWQAPKLVRPALNCGVRHLEMTEPKKLVSDGEERLCFLPVPCCTPALALAPTKQWEGQDLSLN